MKIPRDQIRGQLADLKMPGALEALDSVLSKIDGGRIAAMAAGVQHRPSAQRPRLPPACTGGGPPLTLVPQSSVQTTPLSGRKAPATLP